MSARGTGLGSRSRPWLPSVKAADLPVAGCKDDFDDCSMIAENNDVDAVISFERFRALKLTLFENIRVLKVYHPIQEF